MLLTAILFVLLPAERLPTESGRTLNTVITARLNEILFWCRPSGVFVHEEDIYEVLR